MPNLRNIWRESTRRSRAIFVGGTGMGMLLMTFAPVWDVTAGAAVAGSVSPDTGKFGDIVTITVTGCTVDFPDISTTTTAPTELGNDVLIAIQTATNGTNAQQLRDTISYELQPDNTYTYIVPSEFDWVAGDATAGPTYDVDVLCSDGSGAVSGTIDTFTYTTRQPGGSTTSTTSASTTSTTGPASTTSTTAGGGSTTSTTSGGGTTTSTTPQVTTSTTSGGGTTTSTTPQVTTTSTTPQVTTTSTTPQVTTSTTSGGTTSSTAGATTSSTSGGGTSSTATSSTLPPATLPPGQTSTTLPPATLPPGATTTSSPAGSGSTSTVAPSCTADDTTLSVGQSVAVSCVGLGPASSLAVDLLSDPVRLGSFTANAQGVASGSVLIPLNTTAGSHTLRFTGTAADGSTVVKTIAVSVTRDLPRTGGSEWNMFRISLLLLGIGLLAVGRSQLIAVRD